MGRQVPGTQGQTGNFVSQTSPVPIPLGGKKSCQQSWPKNKANKAWITRESNNPRAANKVKFEEQNLVAGRWWLLRAHVLQNQPLESHLLFIFPKPNTNPPKSPGITTGKQPWYLPSVRGHTHTQSSLQAAGGVLSSAQECAPFSRQGPAAILCPAPWAEATCLSCPHWLIIHISYEKGAERPHQIQASNPLSQLQALLLSQR